MSSAGLVSMSPFREESMMTFLPPQFPDDHGHESILVYIAMSGSLVPMRVMESDSIQSVKLRIQSCKGIFTRNQKLVCQGRELARSDSLVSDYGVGKGNVLHLVLRISDLQVVSVTTCCGREFTYHVERNQNVGHIKSQIAENGGVEDIDDREILLDGEEPLDDKRLIYELSKNGENEATIHLFVRKSAKVRATPVGKNFELSIAAPEIDTLGKRDEDNEGAKVSAEKPSNGDIFLEPVIVNPKIELHEEISELIKSTIEGLEAGQQPIRSSEGTGGAYFMPNPSGEKYISVFKPSDEEPLAPNNPRGLIPSSEDGEGLKKGTRVGEGALRECAVYLLDHPKNSRRSFSGEAIGFAGVPPTAFVSCLHRGFNHPRGVRAKMGSLQMFVENDGSCEDVGPNAFPVEEVHKIAVLDMRMANADRHAGNILMKRDENDGKISLVPIDHGYCLPYSFEDCTFEWLYWAQSRRPFDEETVEYVKSMDAEQDIEMLRFYGWDPPLECARVLRISTMLLKKGVERGLTPFDIGSMMCREAVSRESVVEEIVREALESVLPYSSESAFMESVSGIVDRRLEEIAGK